MISNKFKYYILGILSIIAILIWIFISNYENQTGVLKVNFFDIGQGDAILIEAPFSKQILIDGGPDAKIVEKLGNEIPFYDKTIEIIVVTHPDADHITGLVEVLKRYKVALVMETGVLSDSKIYRELEKTIKEKNIPVKIVQAGQIIKLFTSTSIFPIFDGEGGGEGFFPQAERRNGEREIILSILYPFKNFSGQTVSNTNDTSIVSRLIYGDYSFLFTGDLEKAGEYNLINNEINLKSNILKVGHHGSKTSTSDLFLGAVEPDIAVIQVGKKNKYGHPTEEVLEKLQNITTLRNDIDGDIEVCVYDGKTLKIGC